MQSGRLAYLMARKAQLDVEVDKETSAINPNQFRLHELKRRKLQIKEEIQRVGSTS